MRGAPILGRHLTLEGAARIGDGAGGWVETWAPLGTLWAEVRPGRGREATGEAGALSRVTWRITVRAAVPGSVARPIAGQRFREGDRVFRILSVAEADAGGRYLACEADEETGA
jgi:head-tail adaptor